MIYLAQGTGANYVCVCREKRSTCIKRPSIVNLPYLSSIQSLIFDSLAFEHPVLHPVHLKALGILYFSCLNKGFFLYFVRCYVLKRLLRMVIKVIMHNLYRGQINPYEESTIFVFELDYCRLMLECSATIKVTFN